MDKQLFLIYVGIIVAILSVTLAGHNISSAIRGYERRIMCDEVVEYPNGGVVCEIFIRGIDAEKIRNQGVGREDRI